LDGVCVPPAEASACPEDWEVIPIMPDANGAASVEGNNAEIEDRRRATCGEFGGAGQTAVFSYVAPVAGTYLIRADAPEGDPILFARRLCDYDLGPLGRDLACNDNRDEDDLGSSVGVSLEVGEQVYLFVDSPRVGVDGDGDGEPDNFLPMWAGDFTLSVVRALPPELVTAAISHNPATNAIGVRATWSDPEDDVVGLYLTFLDEGGQELQVIDGIIRGFVDFAEDPVDNGDGTRSGVATLDFDRIVGALIDLDDVATTRIEVIDYAALTSAPVELMFSPPPVLERNAPCDLLGVLDQCAEGLECMGVGGRPPTCG
jgi:hypothetical protein